MAAHVNGPLHWEQLGKEGIPIAFVHPNPMDHTCWLYQMAHLATWYRCLGIDLPGYGKSPTAQPGLTMPDVAQACWEAPPTLTYEASARTASCCFSIPFNSRDSSHPMVSIHQTASALRSVQTRPVNS